MKISLALAGLISLSTAFLHIFGGGPEFHVPLLESNLTIGLKAGYSAIWHQITALFLVSGIGLLYAAKYPEGRSAIALLTLAQFAAFTVLFLFYGRTYLGTIWQYPQWVILIVMSALIIFGFCRTESIQT